MALKEIRKVCDCTGCRELASTTVNIPMIIPSTSVRPDVTSRHNSSGDALVNVRETRFDVEFRECDLCENHAFRLAQLTTLFLNDHIDEDNLHDAFYQTYIEKMEGD